MRFDNKSLLRLSTSGLFNFLRLSSKVYVLPSVSIYPTDFCNHDCVMCAIRRSNPMPRVEMEFSLMEKIIDECATMFPRPRLHFSGSGEPLAYSKIQTVMELCNQRGLKWGMTTNGLILSRFAEQLVVNNCVGVNVSIHGTAAEHDKITGTPGSFENVVKGLQALAVAKKEHSKETPLVALNCVISNDNVSMLQEILDTYSDFPANSITFQHLTFSESELDEGLTHLITSQDKLEELAEFLAYIEHHELPIGCRAFPRIKREDLVGFYTDRDYHFNSVCLLPWLNVRIHPTGDVEMCNEIYGTLKTDSLRAVMNSEKALEFRDKVHKGKFNSPLCFRCCQRQYY